MVLHTMQEWLDKVLLRVSLKKYNYYKCTNMKKKILFITLLFATSFVYAQSNMPWIDVSTHQSRQTVISQGTESLYNGHPTTVYDKSTKTIYCTWSYNHGGKAGFFASSTDAGKTWKHMKAPKDWQRGSNCPSIYRLKDKKGVERMFIFAAWPNMMMTYSEDNGQTWSEMKSLNKPCIMAFSSIIQLKDGTHLGLYHRGRGDHDRPPLEIWGANSLDGGVTWEKSFLVSKVEGRSPCEPYVFRSPNGRELCCIMRENERKGNSLMTFSTDEGKTWTKPIETPWGLSGDRHHLKYTKDGRLIAVFRDMAHMSPMKGHFVAWVGHYKDLKENTTGQYRIKLLHSYAGSDCGYPGLEVLDDDTVVATTYIDMSPTKEKHSIVSVRFKLSELDKML